jgi:transcriptional regulator with XRE-family HTH domain
MKADKRKRLEAAGWRVGSTAEFLGLSDAEQRLVNIKLALAEMVRNEREARGLSQSTLASSLASSQSRVSKAERADPSVTLDLLFRSLFTMGASAAAIAKVISRLDSPRRGRENATAADRHRGRTGAERKSTTHHEPVC